MESNFVMKMTASLIKMKWRCHHPSCNCNAIPNFSPKIFSGPQRDSNPWPRR